MYIYLYMYIYTYTLINIYIYIYEHFSQECSVMVFHWLLNDEFFQVSRTLLSIFADLNNWMVSTGPLISKTFNSCTNIFVSAPSALITINYHRHFHVPKFFQFFSKVWVIISLLVFFQFYPVGTIQQVLFFFCRLLFGLARLAKIKQFVCVSKFHKSLCVSFPRTDSGLLLLLLLLLLYRVNFLHLF